MVDEEQCGSGLEDHTISNIVTDHCNKPQTCSHGNNLAANHGGLHQLLNGTREEVRIEKINDEQGAKEKSKKNTLSED
jgi:hypothetical protein